MAKKLPKQIYARWNEDNEPFLDVADEPSLLSASEDTVEAGLYVLKQKVKLVNKTEVIKK